MVPATAAARLSGTCTNGRRLNAPAATAARWNVVANPPYQPGSVPSAAARTASSKRWLPPAGVPTSASRSRSLTTVSTLTDSKIGRI